MTTRARSRSGHCPDSCECTVHIGGEKLAWSLAAEQGVKPVSDPDTLYGDFWPEDESMEEFLTTLRRWRQEGG